MTRRYALTASGHLVCDEKHRGPWPPPGALYLAAEGDAGWRRPGRHDLERREIVLGGMRSWVKPGGA